MSDDRSDDRPEDLQDDLHDDLLDENDIPRVSVSEAHSRLGAGSAVFVDVRDPASYAAGHIPGALHVNDHNVDAFVATADRGRPHIVYCYHGHSSLGGTAYLLEQGFKDVASLEGGYADWARNFPGHCERGAP